MYKYMSEKRNHAFNQSQACNHAFKQNSNTDNFNQVLFNQDKLFTLTTISTLELTGFADRL